VTAVQILNIEEAGLDYVLFKDVETSVMVKFADDRDFTKEDSAGFFRHLVGKPAAIPVSDEADHNFLTSQDGFYIAVDMWRDLFGDLKVVPFNFAIAAIEVNGIDYSQWRKKLTSWKPIRKSSAEPCWLCDEIGSCTTYQSPDWSRSQDWAYDICGQCERKLGFGR
jgi:hypothetical protein